MQESASEGLGPGDQGNLVVLQYPGSSTNPIVGMKSSLYRETFAAQHKDGSFSIMKVNNKGTISKYVLDPNLRCVFWDNEEILDQCQQLFAQDSNGDVFLYTVDSGGVTQALCVPATKLANVVKSPYELRLVGCDRSHIVFCVGSLSLACVRVTQNSGLHLSCTLPLPDNASQTKKETDESGGGVKKDSDLYQILNGIIILYDPAVNMMFMHLMVTGHCICQLDLQPLGIHMDNLTAWRLSHDFSVLIVLFSNWQIMRVEVTNFASAFPSGIKLLDNKGREQPFSLEYLGYILYQYRDASKKGDSSDQFGTSPGSKSKQSVSKKDSSKKSRAPKHVPIEEVLAARPATVSMDYQSMLEIKECQGDSWMVDNVETSNDTLTLGLVRGGQEGGDGKNIAVCFANFSDMTILLYSFYEGTRIVLSSQPGCPHQLWSDKALLYLSQQKHFLKDDLLSWAIIHSPEAEGISVTEGSKAALTLSALRSSLSHQQVDMLNFYFKSKQELLSYAMQRHLADLLVEQVYMLEDPLSLVSALVMKNVSGDSDFATKLLTLTLDFVYSLLDEAKGFLQQMEAAQEKEGRAQKVGQIKQACKILLSQLASLRKCMRALSQPDERTSLTRTARDDLSFDNQNSLEQVIKESKYSSLQFLLMIDDQSRLVQYENLVAELFDSVKTHLENKDIASCQLVLTNLGCDVLSTLWSLAQYYAKRSLQRFVISQLSSAAALTPEQRQLVQNLEQLYDAYPCESFNESMKEKVHDITSTWSDKDDPLKPAVYARGVFLLNHCGEIHAGAGGGQADNALYLSLLMAWLKDWSDQSRQDVLTEAHFLTAGKDDAKAALRSNPDTTWRFLLSHNLIHLIEPLLQSTKQGSEVPSLPGDPEKYLSLAWSHLRRQVAVALVKMKKLMPDTAVAQGVDLASLLPILGGPLQKDHPLEYAGPAFMGKLHQEYISRFVSGDLYLPLWMYCSIHGMKPSELKLSQVPSWFSLFQTFHSIPRSPKDKNLMVKASIMAAERLLGQTNVTMTPEVMMGKGQVLAAVGMLSYLSEGNLNLDHNIVERYLHKYPRLMSALMPEGYDLSVKHVTTVYHLLMGNAGFNIRRLFGWHSTNTFAGEDSPKVMPHFSEGSLTSAVSRHAKLSFPYYLKHGRPAFAFLSFMSEELDRREASLSQKRIQQACGAALWIACQYFDNHSVSSACVVFVELLGQDSLLVRSMVHSGRMLLTHRHHGFTGSLEAKKEQLKNCVSEIVSLLQSCVRSHHRHGNKLISLLQDATVSEIGLEGLERCGFESSVKWTPVISLCQLLSLPLSTTFLQACAQSDNWLMFVYFAQLHQYPIHQLQNLLHSFKSSNLRDHLQYVLNNADSKLFTTLSSSGASSVISSSRSSPGERRMSLTQRSSLYNKIGVQKHTVGPASSSDEEPHPPPGLIVSSFTSRFRQAEYSECELPDTSIPDDVFRLLFHSSSMPSQWRCLLSAAVSLRNPLFAELAACCGCPAVPSLCGWLVASLSQDLKQEVLDSQNGPVARWTQDQLQDLISSLVLYGQEDVLAIGFTIMQPESPLTPFFRFIKEFVTNKNSTACKEHIDHFKDAMSLFDIRRPATENESDIQTIGDRVWFEEVAYHTLCHELRSVKTHFDAMHLLRLLDQTNMCLVFSFDVLNFSVLHKVMNILHNENVPGLNLSLLLTSGLGSDAFADQCEKATDYLISEGHFLQAQELASVAGFSPEKITINQLKSEKEKLKKCDLWSAKSVRLQFWEKCRQVMAKSECGTNTYADFFTAELEDTSVEYEKSILCEHWFSLIAGCEEETVVKQRENVFRSMWRHRIAAKIAIDTVDPLDLIFDEGRSKKTMKGDLKSDLLKASDMNECISDMKDDLSPQELEILDELMGSYLDDGLVSACAQVASIFGHYNQDLAIIQTCNAIARGQRSVDTMEPAMKRLAAKATTQKRLSHTSIAFDRSRSYSVASLSSLSSHGNEDSSTEDRDENKSILEKLYPHCTHGKQVCLRIITCYKISGILELDYEKVVMAPEFDSLRLLLKTDHSSKYTLARDFLSTCSLSDGEVTGFLADSIVDVLKMFVDKDSDLAQDSPSAELMSNPAEVFAQFIKLCQNSAMLGDRILQSVAALAPESETLSASVLTIQTELIIMAHECYTMSSNMEGISHVLRAARVLCDFLSEAGEFTLMIRLLTGVGRYSEMLYIFHIMQQQHQFELLLRKGMDREDKLKVAILDYLKRYQPDDSEAYTMVALKFSMFRDIANMLENLGHKTMKQMKDKNIETLKETPDLLMKCLQYFQDAAESYVKDNSVRKAQKCIKLARLISLQQQFLSSGIVIIHLSRNEVSEFVNTHPRFIEAMVVSDAYERRSDWSDAIYNNVVVNGDLRYLQELRLHVYITATLVEDVVNKYKQASLKPSGALVAIKKLLSQCKDAQLQYRLASELGLTDMLTSMLKGDSGSYLQDISIH